jgi:recombination protein RecA
MSQQEWDKSMEEKSYGGISKPLTMFAKKIEQLMSKYECTGIGINQLRDKINSPYGGTTTVGGWGWKYLCGSRMEFKRGKFIDEKGNDLTRSAENPAGNIVIMSITKSKFCPATRRVGQYTLNYTYGIDYLKDLVDVAIKYDIIDRRGAWFSIQSPDTGEVLKDKIQGQANVYAELEANEELLKEVERLVDERMYENQSS